MSNHLVGLPSVLVLGFLVAIFFSLQRRHTSGQERYWLIGWGLMFLHFLADTLPPGLVNGHLQEAILLSTVQLAGAAFLMSVSWRSGQDWPSRGLGLALALPLLAYAALLAWQVQHRWLFLVCIAAFFLAGAAGELFGRTRSRFKTSLQWAGIALLGIWTLLEIQQRGTEAGFWLLPAIEFAAAAVLFWRRFSRISPGVITVSLGFLAWASVWAVPVFLPWLPDRPGFSSEFWHFPYLIVAFGMIVVLVEDESQGAQAAKKHLRQLADITSGLLSGVEVKPYCRHIAQVFTKATTFLRVAIFLQEQDEGLLLAGHSGWAEGELTALEAAVAQLTPARAEELIREARRTGRIAVFLDFAALGQAAVTGGHAPAPALTGGGAHGELVVPLHSSRGGLVGLILLDQPRDPRHVNVEELSKIEMLAMDIAVAVNNAAMQRQLLLNEKLASIGQLVRGVAHEMNNPLTSVLGYAELLADRSREPELQHGLEVILREGQRMKRILGNLSRFAQQERPDRRLLDLRPLLRDVLGEKTQEAQAQGIEVVSDLAPELPPVVFDERQLRQVFSNVLNNAIDAVQEAGEKRVTVIARANNGHVILSFLDTGPGFSEPSRVFDPFFTTKSPGKGVGLGLSICYGVLKQHGGNIAATNLEPRGACITIELPCA
jgi:signal transduction histidine kinase